MKPVYASAAPTEVLGLIQVVIQIPWGVQPGGYVPVELQVGSGSTVRGVGELNRYEAALSFPEFRK